jgi:outer membrane protein TolC
MNRFFPLLILACGAGSALPQTPPIKPQTPDIKVPPPITIPGPDAPEIAAGAMPLGIEEAVDIALNRQAAIAIAKGNVQVAEGQTQAARSALLPQLTATAGTSEQQVFRGTAQVGSNRFSTGISLSQLLFDFGRTRDQVRQLSTLEEASRATLTDTQREVAYQARVAYFNLAQNLENVRISQENVDNRQRQLSEAEARVDAGLGSPGDFVRAKTSLADAVIALESARNNATDATVLLAERLGIDPRTPIIPSASAAVSAPVGNELGELVKIGLEQRADVKAAQFRVTAASLGVAVAKLTSTPRVSLVAGVSARGANDPFESQSGSIGLNLSWTFGDSGLTAGNTKAARGQEEVARATLVDLSKQVISEISRALVDVQTARQRLETAQAQVANAQELVRISEGRYSGGIGTFLEVTDAQSSLYSAQRNLTQATADTQRAASALNRAIGQ